MINGEFDLDSATSYKQLDEFVRNKRAKRNSIIILRCKNSKGISTDFINKVRKRYGDDIKIRILGSYDDEEVKRYPNRDFLVQDNLYSLDETEKIVNELEIIEKGINPEWDDLQKLIYFIGQLKNKVIYHPLHEYQSSKQIRSLVGLFTKTTVCAGYSVMLKELCDRNGIECHFVMGSCNKEDAKDDKTTHAWNLVRINGQLFPIDLTWNAGKNKKGRFFSIDDLANVNKFIESHFPTSKEPIQNYKNNLKSIDGDTLRRIDFIVNKDITYDTTVVNWVRPKDNSKFKITLVGEHIIDGEYLYKYVYEKIKPDGTYGLPSVIYSRTNICAICEWYHQRAKLKKKLTTTSNEKKKEKIRSDLEKTKIFDEMYEALELLLSRENLSAAGQRGDYYIGKIHLAPDKNDKENKVVEGVYVDPDYAKKLPYKQRRFTRSDGTSFIIEYYGTITINGCTFNQYRMFEGIMVNGERVYKKNTIYTDSNEDLLTDPRSNIPNDFLARDRVDRKTKETAGYLGYMDKNGIRTYDPKHNELFKKEIYKAYRLRSNNVLDYFESISFEEMQRLIKTYKQVVVNGQKTYVNRYNNKPVTDNTIKAHLDFSYLWLHAAGIKYTFDDVAPGYLYAFNEPAKEVYEMITSLINDSIEKTGDIDAVVILKRIKDVSYYKYAEDIVSKLFSGEANAKIIANLYKKQNPSSRKEVKVIHYFDRFYPKDDAVKKLDDHERQLEEEKKHWFEVKDVPNGYVVEPYKK